MLPARIDSDAVLHYAWRMPHAEPVRQYDADRDADAVDRIHREVGWLGSSLSKPRADARERFIRDSTAFVADIDGVAECYAASMPGSMLYRGRPIAFSGITSVLTSRIARQRGLAGSTTAALLRDAALDGATVMGLGMFDQGYYERHGFGTGACDHYAMFDPSLLNVPYCRRTPVRLTADDSQEMHAARLRRLRAHGAVSLDSPATTEFMARRSDGDFGLGFRDGVGGELTHHLWINPDRAGTGPYKVLWMAYDTYEQFIELLGLLRNLGDQVYLVRVVEPGGLQLQDFLDRPFRRHAEAKGGAYETYSTAVANFQFRVLDVGRAVDAVASAHSDDVSIRIDDPAARYELDGWNGVGGVYRCSFGATSRAKPIDPAEEAVDITMSVGDFTRVWLGVLPASTLYGLGRVTGDRDAASALDSVFIGSLPHTDWMF